MSCPRITCPYNHVVINTYYFIRIRKLTVAESPFVCKIYDGWWNTDWNCETCIVNWGTCSVHRWTCIVDCLTVNSWLWIMRTELSNVENKLRWRVNSGHWNINYEDCWYRLVQVNWLWKADCWERIMDCDIRTASRYHTLFLDLVLGANHMCAVVTGSQASWGITHYQERES